MFCLVFLCLTLAKIRMSRCQLWKVTIPYSHVTTEAAKLSGSGRPQRRKLLRRQSYLDRLEGENQITFRYCTTDGEISAR